MSQRRFIAVWSFVLILGLTIFFTLLASHPLSAQDAVAQLEPVRTFDAKGGLYAFDVSFSRDEFQLASAYKGAHVHVWNPSTGEKRRTLDQPMGPMKRIYQLMMGIPPGTYALEFAPKPPWASSVLAAGYEDGVRLWDAKTGEIKKHLIWNQRSRIRDLEFSPEGVFLGAVTLKGLAMIWNTRSNKLMREFRAHGPNDRITNEVAFSPIPVGKYMATGAKNGLIRIWDWKEARGSQGGLNDTEAFHVTTLRQHYQEEDERHKDIKELIFWSDSADTIRLLSSSWDRTVRVWSIPDGDLLKTIRFDVWGASAVAISPDRQLMALGRNKTIEIRSLPSGELLAEGQEHTNSIQAVEFSPSGNWLATGSGDINPRERDDRVILWKNPFYEEGPWAGSNDS